MATNDTKGVALVAGGSGIVGHSVAMELKGQGCCEFAFLAPGAALASSHLANKPRRPR
jgi:hypothetical protein